MNTITTKKNSKRINKIMAIVLFIAVFVMSTATFASAGNNNDAADALKDLADYIFAIGQVIGVIMAFFGIIQIGQSISTHDPAQRTTGFLVVAGGVIIFFAEDLLDLIGVTV